MRETNAQCDAARLISFDDSFKGCPMPLTTTTHRPKRLVLDELKACGAVAVVRADPTDGLFETIEALLTGGLRAIEITLTTPGAITILRQLATRFTCEEILLGAGTVLETDEALAAIAAGAEYLVSPSVEPDVIELCQSAGVVSIPGAYTPTEIRTAVKAGADIVKVFPASIGGPAYIKDLSGPLPGVPLLPSGGVNFDTVVPFLKAGAFAVAVGSLLVDKQLIREGNFAAIAEKTRKFMDLVAANRR
jgi:2-dehydro-3-deoxyphosphogluconate aldolase/(4S)-4-hydroxy-2-oxoglutarate aldolase